MMKKYILAALILSTVFIAGCGTDTTLSIKKSESIPQSEPKTIPQEEVESVLEGTIYPKGEDNDFMDDILSHRESVLERYDELRENYDKLDESFENTDTPVRPEESPYLSTSPLYFSDADNILFFSLTNISNENIQLAKEFRLDRLNAQSTWEEIYASEEDDFEMVIDILEPGETGDFIINITEPRSRSGTYRHVREIITSQGTYESHSIFTVDDSGAVSNLRQEITQ